MSIRSFRGFGKVFSCLKSRRAALNYGKSSKQVTLTVLVLLLTFSIVLAVPDTSTTKTHTQLSFSSKTADSKGELLWDKTFGGTSWDEGYCVAQTSDGGYIIAGETYSFGAGVYDVWLIKTDENGNEEWNQTYGGTNYDRGYCVRQTSDGGYILTGNTYSFGIGGSSNVWLIKTDENGEEEWNQTYGGGGIDFGRCVEQTTDGGYIIAGDKGFFWNPSDTDVWLIKTDANGNLDWNQTFGGKSIDSGRYVEQTLDGGYIITGNIYSHSTDSMDVCLIKTDANGDELWNKLYGGTGNDWGRCVKQTADGGYIITGNIQSHENPSVNDVWLIKTDASGDEEWNQTYGGTDQDYGQYIAQTSDDGYIITGSTESYGNPGVNDVWLIKTDANGEEEWNQTYGGTRNDKGNSVLQTSDGGYIIVGYTYSFGAGWSDVWLIKDSRFKNLEDTKDNDDKNILSNNNVTIIAIIGVSVTISALFGKYLSRKIKHRNEKPKENGEWEGVFFKYK